MGYFDPQRYQTIKQSPRGLLKALLIPGNALNGVFGLRYSITVLLYQPYNHAKTTMFNSLWGFIRTRLETIPKETIDCEPQGSTPGTLKIRIGFWGLGWRVYELGLRVWDHIKIFKDSGFWV